MPRKFLVATAAAAPMLLYAGYAFAEVEVTSSSRTTAITTASPNGGSADDVKVTEDGVITLSASGAIVTLNSDNTVTMNGGLASVDVDDSVGVLVLGGHTGTVTSEGTISLTEDYDYEDSDDDGDYDGLFAKGYRRYGIRVTGTDAFTGTITNSGTITIEGMDSAGISVEVPLVGNLVHSGSISVTGDRGYGIHIAAPVTGKVQIEGSTSVTGEGSVGVAVDSAIDGAFVLQGSVYSSGYRVTSRYSDPDDRALLDADDMLEGGGGVNIAANVTGGVLLDTPPTDTNDDTSDDEDGDGVTDSSEGSASISVYGGAPALKIGSNSNTVTIGAVGTGDDAYGLIIRGSVSAASVYDGVETTGVQIGGDAGYETLITNGIRISGSVGASAYEAQTNALRLKAGAIADTIWNAGTISATTISEGDYSARALVIDSGAATSVLNNDGVISATVSGEKGTSYAILDNSGTLTTINNTRTIAAYVVATDDDDDTDASNETITGKSIAIDVSKNTTGVTITQTGVNDGDDGDDGVADTDTDGDGVDDADEPAIIGKIRFGSGDDTLNVLNGTVIGDISFGDGADNLTIDGGGYVLTGLSDTDGRLNITIGDGVLGLTNTNDLKVTNLTLGSSSKLIFSVDPTAGTWTRIVADTATLATGTNLGLVLNNLLTTASTFEVIRAGTLTAGDISQDLLGDAPYLYVASAYQSGNSVNIDVRRRTASEAGMTTNQAAAYDAVFAALSKNDDIAGAFLNQSTRDGFYNLYSQMLPDQGLGMFSALQAVNQQISAATMIRPDQGERYGPDSVWVQQINTMIRREDGSDQGSDTQALGFVAGYEAMGDAGGALGVTLAMVNIEEHDTTAKAGERTVNTMVQAGLYWRRSVGGWRFNLGGGAGYGWLTGDRSFYSEDVDGDGEADASATNVAHWNGAMANAFAGIAYEQKLGRYFVRPESRLDYVYFSEGKRSETGGGDGFDLIRDARSFSNLSGDIGLVLGAQFGEAVWWRPEIRIGYRKTLSGNIDDTVARFRSGESFTLTSVTDKKGAPTLGFAIRAGSTMSYLALEGGAEAAKKQTRYYMRFSGRSMF
ncbi:autotransporter outer membrane beta-barrel domain-containing protein [Caulobacter sp. RL271]|uniref:Autotransporter outer membrane beta-barrel domain-containing protein n=1 Tax=Caulobacter segnis TaxID=88688 RepID=A0ABY4ZPK5_9CAUL|nr:autotransporter outer membrane beta-barrel domain-containing protein [Caulobacter segnis]USQ93891.1 autotransporter outer membrane beta-barrel domain-containing protein [Caulobacter segnis]